MVPGFAAGSAPARGCWQKKDLREKRLTLASKPHGTVGLSMRHDYDVLAVAHPPDVWSVATKQATKRPDGKNISIPLRNTYPGTSKYRWTRPRRSRRFLIGVSALFLSTPSMLSTAPLPPFSFRACWFQGLGPSFGESFFG